jgi:hypothetical protein
LVPNARIHIDLPVELVAGVDELPASAIPNGEAGHCAHGLAA